MATRCLWLLFLATSIPLANAQTAAPPTSPAKGPIRISIKNEYTVDLNFGPLGGGGRIGTDEAKGVLEWQDGEYVGTVTATVDSNQTITGLIGKCGPGHYKQSQELTVVGRDVDDFNSLSQSVTYNSGSAGNEHLSLKFKPKTAIPLPTRGDNGDLNVACHTLIERPQGFPFLPLNDTRWTAPEGGYIIVLPATGVLNYTDDQLAGGQGGDALSPVFNVYNSRWTIEVERLP